MFYVYELCDKSGKPFYIGKGTGKRIDVHERAAKNGSQLRVHRKIRSLWSKGEKIVKRIVFETPDETIAFAKEKELIAGYGIENLTNLTTGGEGAIPCDEIRQKMSRTRKGKIPVWLIGKPSWNKGKSPTNETRKKISDALKGTIPASLSKCWAPEARAKHSKTMTGKSMPEKTRNKISATLKTQARKPKHTGKHLPDNWKAKIKASMLRNHRRPTDEALRKSRLSKYHEAIIRALHLLGYSGA